MSDVKKLNELLKSQSALMEEICAETQKLSGDFTQTQIEALKEQNDVLKKKCDDLSVSYDEIKEQHKTICDTLDSQLKSEKRNIALNSREKMKIYFGETNDKAESKIEALQSQVKKRMSRCKELLDGDMFEVKEKYLPQIQQLEIEIYTEIESAKTQYKKREHELATSYNTALGSMAASNISDSDKQKIIKPKDNKVERILGLNILSAVGAGFIVLAVIVLAFFLYDYLPAWANAVILFAGAAAVLALGLVMNRKRNSRTVFSLTILSIGVGFLYTALAVSYFFLGVFNIWWALGICAVITAIVYVISAFYKSQLIVIFAQIGGYLPIIALGEQFVLAQTDMPALYGAMGYFIILSVLGFVFSTKYKWQILNYISFGLNMLATIFVAGGIATLHTPDSFTIAEGITLLFMFVSFALHTLLPVFTNIRRKSKFTAGDFTLIIIATVINLVLFLIMFEAYSIGISSNIINLSGYLSLLFAAFYIGIYFIVRVLSKKSFAVRTIFWMTAIVFLILFVPMQFYDDSTWISFGWTLMGAALVIFGILKSKRFAFITGCAVSSIAVTAFIIVNTIMGAFLDINYIGTLPVYIYMYLFITLASIAILVAAIYKRKMVLGYLGTDKHTFLESRVNPAQVYSVAVYVNLTGFLIYAMYHLFDWVLPHNGTFGNQMFLMLICMVGLMFLMSAIAPKLFKGYAVRGASQIMSLFSIFFLLVVMCFRLPLFWNDAYFNLGWQIGMGFAISLITLAGVFVFMNLYLVFDRMVKRRIGKGLVMATACYFLFWYTLVMMNQFTFHITSIAITIPFIVVAFTCIGLGLYMRSPMTRRFAIALVIVSIAKLFIIDTWALNLDLIFQVINYAVFGVLLIGMSLLYQFFYRKYAKVKPGEKKNKKRIDMPKDED